MTYLEQTMQPAQVHWLSGRVVAPLLVAVAAGKQTALAVTEAGLWVPQ